MKTLQSNKLIRKTTDTPVHNRVTEAEGTEEGKRHARQRENCLVC